MLSNQNVTLCSVIVCAALTSSCGGRLPPDVVNPIAICTGGFSTDVQANIAVAAAFDDRRGEIISGVEIEQKGVSAFDFGELTGAHAIEFYNAYVECVDREGQRSRPLQNVPGVVSIDAVIPVDPRPGALVALDVIVRNTTTSPIAITNARFEFDEHLRGFLNSVLEVSGAYVVSVDESGAVVEGPLGTQDAYAWYPSEFANHFIVVSPVSQVIGPNEIDRFRLTFSGDDLVGPFESVIVSLRFDGDKSVESSRINLNR